MEKILAFLLTALVTLSSMATSFSHEAQSMLDSAKVPYCLAGRAVANALRAAEEKKQVIPAREPVEKKVLADDTGDDFKQTENEMTAKTWVANEITLTSEKAYADPFNDAELELILVGNGVKYIVPGFWDGGNTWKIRFVCPSAGEWYYKTVCSDSENKGLDGISCKVVCSEYDGELEIYRHGFISTAYGKKYFTYDDGTPFFYLGDTHWSLGDETVDMVKTITEKRASQGFTVWQSEPIGAGFDVTNGITDQDMAGFADFDAKFRIIAEAGLVHANAEFFFPAYMHSLILNMGGYTEGGYASDSAKAYLEKVTRYWIARYGAYPVLWTLGQETDNDFYNSGAAGYSWNSNNNPYKLVAEYIEKYDPYQHPLSAHMEYAGSTSVYGNGNGTGEKLKVYANGAEPSAFRNVPNHSWYAIQWAPSLIDSGDHKIEKDAWYNSQGKPAINYEGHYDHLWTKTFGSRMQGWAAYLNGMYGYGWGAHDTWSYLNIYDEETDSFDGVDHITSEEKRNTTWEDALNFPSADQCGYMKDFFTSFDWWNLIPRFDNKLYFRPKISVKSFTASNADNSKMVIYFFSFCDPSLGEIPNSNEYGGSLTGTIGCLEPSAEYHYKWFDPVTGEYSEEGTFTSTPFGTYSIGHKMINGEESHADLVFYMYK